MLPAIMIATMLSAASATPPAPAPPVQHSTLDWGLDGRVGINEDGRVAFGITWTPNKANRVGIFLDAQAVEWDQNQVSITPYAGFLNGRYRFQQVTLSTVEKDDLKVTAGMSWKFR